MNYNDIINENYILQESIYNKEGYKKYVVKCRRKGKKPLPFEEWKKRNIIKTGVAGVGGVLATGIIADQIYKNNKIKEEERLLKQNIKKSKENYLKHKNEIDNVDSKELDDIRKELIQFRLGHLINGNPSLGFDTKHLSPEDRATYKALLDKKNKLENEYTEKVRKISNS